MAVDRAIPRAALLWVLAVMVLIVLPHLNHLPIWVMLLSAMAICWRWLIFLGRAAYPGKLVRAMLLLAVSIVAFVQFRGQGMGMDVTVSLLVCGVALKLLEMRYKSDIYIVNTLGFLTLMSVFLYTQTMLISLYSLCVIALILASLVSLNREVSGEQSTAWHLGNIRLSGMLMLQALPLMLVLFVFFPRIAPLWSVPLPGNVTQTGVSDEMTPGDITQLARSANIAFRASFDGASPLPQDMYWRGVVLDRFDGQTWRRSEGRWLRPNELQFPPGDAPALDYNIVLEPTYQTWLYGINVPRVRQPGIGMDTYNTLITARPLTQRLRYDVRSFPGMVTERALSDRARERALQLPVDLNPRTRALAAELRSQFADDQALVLAALGRFRTQDYAYTLTPPAMSDNSIDDFLFDSQQGFCGHYAGAAVFLLRAAGVPARMVVGYQGAEYNRFDDYLIVYQYNAHAWIEVWLDGQGWQHFDPTAWVAPDRIEQGATELYRQSLASQQEGGLALALSGVDWLNTLRLRFDALEYAWNLRVLGYNESTQLDFLRDLFGEQRMAWLPAIVVLILLALLTGLAVLLLMRGRSPTDPLIRELNRFFRVMADKGVARDRGEAPGRYFARLETLYPEQTEDIRACGAVLDLSLYGYAEPQPHEQLLRFKTRLRQLGRQLGRQP